LREKGGGESRRIEFLLLEPEPQERKERFVGIRGRLSRERLTTRRMFRSGGLFARRDDGGVKKGKKKVPPKTGRTAEKGNFRRRVPADKGGRKKNSARGSYKSGREGKKAVRKGSEKEKAWGGKQEREKLRNRMVFRGIAEGEVFSVGSAEGKGRKEINCFVSGGPKMGLIITGKSTEENVYIWVWQRKRKGEPRN